MSPICKFMDMGNYYSTERSRGNNFLGLSSALQELDFSLWICDSASEFHQPLEYIRNNKAEAVAAEDGAEVEVLIAEEDNSAELWLVEFEAIGTVSAL